MSRKCRNCGAPAPGGTAAFCNRCGSRLPAAGEEDVLTCRTCGKAVTDRQSRFCDQCGSPLVPAVQAASPAPPAVKRRNCPSCGFENFGENLFYCRKCGTILPKYETVPAGRPAAKAASGRQQPGGISIIPDGMDEFRQKPVDAPGAARPPSWDAPVAVRRPPAKAEAKVMPQKFPREAPELREWVSRRKVTIIAGIILLILIIAAIVIYAPGILNGGSANTTAPDATDTGLPGALMGIIPLQAPARTPGINRGTAVVRDTPLLPYFG